LPSLLPIDAGERRHIAARRRTGTCDHRFRRPTILRLHNRRQESGIIFRESAALSSRPVRAATRVARLASAPRDRDGPVAAECLTAAGLWSAVRAAVRTVWFPHPASIASAVSPARSARNRPPQSGSAPARIRPSRSRSTRTPPSYPSGICVDVHRQASFHPRHHFVDSTSGRAQWFRAEPGAAIGPICLEFHHPGVAVFGAEG
jgi:hypothetical protein